MNIRKLLDWKTLFIYVHRWAGIVFGVVFVVWFVSGVLTSWAGNTPTNVPERLGSLWLSWNLPQSFQVQGGMRYIGRRYLNNANTATTPSATVVDAGIRKNVTGNLSVDLRATNLLDEFYLQNVSGAPIPTRGRYGAPRLVELTFNARF